MKNTRLWKQIFKHNGFTRQESLSAGLETGSLITPWRLKWYSIAVISGLFSALIIVLLSGSGPRILSGRLGGDFTPFYAVGRMVAATGFQQLYDKEHQFESQTDLFPGHKGFLPFPYPPYVALFCFPLSFFSYRAAFVIYLFVNISSLFMAFMFLRKIFPRVDEYFLPVVIFSMTFFPFLKAILNGQLTAIIFLLFAIVWLLTIKGKPYSAGFFMGLLIFKPQFAIPLMGVFMLSGRLKIAFSAVSAACLIIVISLYFTGIKPYIEWYHFLKWFVPADAHVNGHNAVSWIGFLDAVFGTDNKITFILGYACCFAIVLFISYVWAVGGTKSDFNAQMGLAAVSFVLIPSHIMFYDAGLIVLTYIVIITSMQRHQIKLLGFAWLAGLTQIFAEKIGFSPLFFLVLFTFVLSIIHLTASAVKQTEEFTGYLF